MARVVASATENQRHKDDVQRLCFMDGHLYSGSYDGVVKKWSSDLREVVQEWKAFDYPVNAMVCSETNKRIYLADCDGNLRVFDPQGQLIQSAQLKSHLNGKECDIKAMDICNDHIFLADTMGTVMRFDLDLNRTHSADTYTEIWSLAATGDTSLLIARDNYIMKVDLGSQQGGRAGHEVQKQHFFGSPIGAVIGDDLGSTSAGVSPATEGRAPVIVNEKYVACTERRGMSAKTVLNTPDFPSHKSYRGHDMIINALAFLGKDKFISSGWDGKLLLFSTEGPGNILGQTSVDGYVNCLCTSDNDSNVYAAGKNGMVHLIQFAN